MKTIDRIKHYFENVEQATPGKWTTKYELERAVYEALLRGDFGTSKLGIMETITRETRKLVKIGVLEQKEDIPEGYGKKKAVAHYRLKIEASEAQTKTYKPLTGWERAINYSEGENA